MATSATLVFTVYKSQDGWRWRARRGGRTVADGSEAYVSRSNAVRALRRFCIAMADEYQVVE